MLRQDRWKYIRYERLDGKIAEALYDLEADPMELRDLAEEEPETAAAFRAMAEERTDVQGLVRLQKTRARNANLFRAYEKAVDFGIGEMWTGNPPEGREKPIP